MKLKLFIVSIINVIWLLMPQNIIGCGPLPDPKDYYTSFFSNSHIEEESYRPFFYTALLKFYDDWDDYNWAVDPNTVPKKADPLIADWQAYLKNNLPAEDVATLVYEAPEPVIQYVLQLTNGKAAQKPEVWEHYSKNKMLNMLQQTKNTGVLEYLVFAKQVQNYTYSSDPWEQPAAKDSVTLIKAFQNAKKSEEAANDEFLKTKYAFMQSRLAFYAGNYPLCVQVVNQSFGENTPASVLKSMAVAYKAGCFFKMGKNDEAAIEFARAFEYSPKQRKENYLSFLWATDHASSGMQPKVKALAANKHEQATVVAMFSMFGLQYQLENMQEVYALDKQHSLLPLLVVREIHKLEEKYLSPLLQSQVDDPNSYYKLTANQKADGIGHAKDMLLFFEKLAKDNEIKHQPFFKTAAAYTAYIAGDYTKADYWAGEVIKATNLSAQVKHQAKLMKLLSDISSIRVLNTQAEEKLLESLEWLNKQAATDTEYQMFLRNLYSQVLAPKYVAQGNAAKAAWCMGVADLMMFAKNSEEETEVYAWSGIQGIEYVRTSLNTQQAIQLYALYEQKQPSEYDKMLIQNTSFSKEAVIDFIGTSYMRDHQWEEATKWLALQKQGEPLVSYVYDYNTYKTDTIFVDPFHDYLNDWQRYEKKLMQPLSKIDLARKLIAMEKDLATTTDKTAKGRVAYLLGSAYYNLSYYGNAWMAIDYHRSTYLWNDGKQTGWRKDYFEVQKAKSYYQMAYELSGANKEFQAAALFMVAKCTQRQIPKPPYDYDDWNQADKNLKAFEKKFRQNPMFAKFKTEFGGTKFYKYTYARCSYLRDFEKRR